MKRVGVIVAIIYVACLIIPSTRGGSSLAMAEDSPRLTAEQAIAAARSNAYAKPGSEYTVLREIVANDDTRRTGDKALVQAKALKAELYLNGILADILRSGGFLVVQNLPTKDKANSLDPLDIASILHLVSLGSDGFPKEVMAGPAIDQADTQELVKDTSELIEALFTTPSTEELSLESRFYGGKFPEDKLYKGTLFAIPISLQNLGADPNEVREAAALFGGYVFWANRYALSFPVYAASPVTALNAAEGREKALRMKFLRSNHMDPKLDLDLDNVQSKKQLQERIVLLTKLDSFLEDTLKNEGDPSVIKANLSIVTMPLGVEMNSSREEGHYGSSTPSMFMFLWDRLATGGFAVKMITEGS